MPSCVVKLCRNKSTSSQKSGGVTYHLFPKEGGLDKWIKVIRQSRNDPQWQPSKTSVVCSDHFDDDDMYVTKRGLRRVIQGCYPTKNLFVSPNFNIVNNDDPPIPVRSSASSRTSEPVADLLSKEIKIEIVKLKEEHDPLCSTASEFVPMVNSPSTTNVDDNLEAKSDTPGSQKIFVKLETQQQNLQGNVEQLINSNVVNKETELVMTLDPYTAAINLPASVRSYTDDESLSDEDKKNEEYESLFDTPRKHRLREKLKRQQGYLQKYKKKIKNLQQTIRRLTKRNDKLTAKLKNIKSKKNNRNGKDNSASASWVVFTHQEKNK